MTYQMKGYTDFVLRCIDTSRVDTSDKRVLLGALGLAGETGEVVDMIKKEMMHGKAINRQELLLEFGDVFWYLTLLMHCYGFSLEDVIRANVHKLEARYPERHDG